MLSAHSTYLPKSPSLSNLPQSLTLPWGGGCCPSVFPRRDPRPRLPGMGVSPTL